jgi:hypothetical protein
MYVSRFDGLIYCCSHKFHCSPRLVQESYPDLIYESAPVPKTMFGDSSELSFTQYQACSAAFHVQKIYAYLPMTAIVCENPLIVVKATKLLKSKEDPFEL